MENNVKQNQVDAKTYVLAKMADINRLKNREAAAVQDINDLILNLLVDLEKSKQENVKLLQELSELKKPKQDKKDG